MYKYLTGDYKIHVLYTEKRWRTMLQTTLPPKKNKQTNMAQTISVEIKSTYHE